MGPLTLNGVRLAGRSTLGTTPGEGRKPATPQKDAGVRRLPPRSEPVASATWPSASATAEPPEEPAQVLAGSKGLPVGPYTRLVVLAPAPNSGVLVLPTMTPAARRMFATLNSSSAGTLSLNSSEPNVVLSPAVACRSFTPMGSPASKPASSPRPIDNSISFARLRAASTSIATIALTAELVFSMRAMQLSSSSTGDSLRSPMRRRASTAERSQGSVIDRFLRDVPYPGTVRGMGGKAKHLQHVFDKLTPARVR